MNDKTWRRMIMIFSVFLCGIGLMIDFGLMPEMTMRELTATTIINCGLLFGLYYPNFRGDTNGDKIKD